MYRVWPNRQTVDVFDLNVLVLLVPLEPDRLKSKDLEIQCVLVNDLVPVALLPPVVPKGFRRLRRFCVVEDDEVFWCKKAFPRHLIDQLLDKELSPGLLDKLGALQLLCGEPFELLDLS